MKQIDVNIINKSGNMIKIKNKYLTYLKKNRNAIVSYEALYQKPYQILRENYSDKDLRIDGVFFSSADIADRLINMFGVVNPLENVIDPCCGIGDLLLAYVNQFPISNDPENALKTWAGVIYGNDINSDFVDTTKLRLVMNAFYLSNKRYTIGDCIDTWESFYFPHLTVGDAFDLELNNIHRVLLNPPFQQVRSNKKYTWSSGKISMAAIFLYELYQRNKCAFFAAILPDVLRSGSRYQKFRHEMSSFPWEMAKIYGQFDKKTDIDVFLVSNYDQSSTAKKRQKKINTLSHFFDIHVGNIVPHRDPVIGQERFFLTAKNTPKGAELHQFEAKCRSLKKHFVGPFLVIKRTSSPSDAVRCATTLINCKKSFFVENHLIVLLPRDKKVETCRKALKFLNSNECNNSINESIRCRHLTVSSIKQLPYKTGDKQ